MLLCNYLPKAKCFFVIILLRIILYMYGVPKFSTVMSLFAKTDSHTSVQKDNSIPFSAFYDARWIK